MIVSPGGDELMAVWANNGDTISLCYAHTSALKGDFVRTGKRDLSGMLHDGVSSLSRMFYGAVSGARGVADIRYPTSLLKLSSHSSLVTATSASLASSWKP
jgi:hypothetical protein